MTSYNQSIYNDDEDDDKDDDEDLEDLDYLNESTTVSEICNKCVIKCNSK